jgi:hypothetical protein
VRKAPVETSRRKEDHMNVLRLFLLSALASLVLLSPAKADGLLYRLPDDGAFVKFEMESSGHGKGEDKKTYKGTLTMSSVGEAKVDGKLCRWIEIKMEANTPGDHIVKVLVPIDRLKPGESPLDHALKGWRKMIGELNDGGLKEIANFKTMDAGAMPIILPGVLQDAKKLPKKVIDSKLGKLECAGHTGTHASEPARDHKSEITYETWLHEKAPFGVVASHVSAKTFQNGEYVRTWTMTLRVVEVGKGAKSELPDQR